MAHAQPPTTKGKTIFSYFRKKEDHNEAKEDATFIGMSKQHQARDDVIEKLTFGLSGSIEGDAAAAKGKHDLNEEKAYEHLAMWMCTPEEVSPLTVNSPHFIKMTKALNPNFSVCFDSLERTCLNLYKEERPKVKQYLSNFKGWIACSIDLLRLSSYNVLYSNCLLPEDQPISDYLCLTAHFIDDDWNLKYWVLHYGTMDTYEDSPDEIVLKYLSEMGIVNKISALTFAVGLGEDEIDPPIRDGILKKRTQQHNVKPFHLQCCADTFRLMVEYAFGKIESIISDLRLIVVWPKSLPLWHITLHNLQNAIQLESEGEFLKKDEYGGYDIPTSEEWNMVRGVGKLVGFIYNAAEVFFETKSATASLYLHNLQELRMSLKTECSNSYQFISTMAKNMLGELEKHWEDMFLVLALATVLDPRCKMKYIEFSSLKYEGSVADLKIKLVLEALNGLYDEYVAVSLETENPDTVTILSDSDIELDYDSDEDDPSDVRERRANPSFGFNCLEEYNEFIRSHGQSQKSELELYLEEAVVPWKKDLDLLKWWRVASHKYPILSKMARDILAIPFSTANSYDAYHYTDYRSADKSLDGLNPDLANALKCTRSWLNKH